MCRETALLAGMAPSRWHEALRRIGVVRSYCALTAPNGKDAQRHADELKLDVRSFYRLVRAYEDLREHAVPKRSKRGTTRSLSSDAERIISEVRAELGREVPERLVHAEVANRCRTAGLPVPSVSALRTRDAASRVDLRIRLRRTFDVVIDSCPLDVDVTDAENHGDEERVAWLTGLLDGATGTRLGHVVTAGVPSERDLLFCLGVAHLQGEEDVDLLATGGLMQTLQPVDRILATRGLRLDAAASHGLPPGSALVPALGLKVGRISLLPRRKAPCGGRSVPLSSARRVIDKLLDDNRA